MTAEEMNKEIQDNDLKVALQEQENRRNKLIDDAKAKDAELKSPLSQIDDSIKKLKEDNDALEREIQRKELLRAKIELGGRAMAGQYIPEKSKEDIAKEEAKRMLSPFGK